jgi:hypothetical protein
MRKLTLETDALRVESFRTSNETAWRGTVDARSGAEAEVINNPLYEGADAITAPPPPGTLPPAASCDTCYISCVTACSCRTMPCDTCA